MGQEDGKAVGGDNEAGGEEEGCLPQSVAALEGVDVTAGDEAGEWREEVEDEHEHGPPVAATKRTRANASQRRCSRCRTVKVRTVKW